MAYLTLITMFSWFGEKVREARTGHWETGREEERQGKMLCVGRGERTTLHW